MITAGGSSGLSAVLLCVMIKLMFIAGVGGFAGTCVRFLVARLMGGIAPTAVFPWGTFLVNVVGCFLIGIILGAGERLHVLSSTESALFVTGFCGGFTTFSAFANDIYSLGSRGDWSVGALYAALSVAAGVAMVIAGRLVVR